MEDFKEALAAMKPEKTNPYGFIPLLLPLAPLAPLILPAAVIGGVALVSYKSAKGMSEAAASVFSVPVLIGGGAGYAIGAATKADDKTRIAYAVMGLGVGWAVQKYVIAPAAVQAAVEAEKAAVAAEKAAYEANFKWYNPMSWF